jgi:DNA modification methylase
LPTIEFIEGDATNISFIKNSSIDLIITHPPYPLVDSSRYGDLSNKQINYNHNKFLKLMIKATKEMERVLKKDGSIWINIGPSEDAMPYRYLVEVLDKTNLYHSSTIIHRNKDAKDLFKNLEEIEQDFWLWFQFTKIKQGFYFNPFKVKKYNNPIWELDITNQNSEVDLELKNKHKWDINDTTPKELPERLIEMFSKKGEMVLDVFSGSALVPVTAYLLGRNSIGVDISKDQKDLAEKRLEITKRIGNE